MTRKTGLHKKRIVERIGLKLLLTVGVIVGGLFALPGTVHAAATDLTVSEPQGLTLTYGHTTDDTLSVVAGGVDSAAYDITYQWYKNNLEISGATEASYTIPTEEPVADSITYYCAVTATNKTDPYDTSTVNSTPALVTINKITLIIKWDGGSVEYDGASHQPTASFAGLLGSDNYEPVIIGGGTYYNAGVYPLTASAPDGLPDYYALGVVEYTFHIRQRKLTVSGITAKNRDYDGTVRALLDTTSMSYNKVDSDDVTVSVTGSFADANVGENKAITLDFMLEGEKQGNYIMADSQPELTASITKKSIAGATVTLDATAKEYTGEEHTVNVTQVTLSDGTILSPSDYDVSGNTETEIGEYTVNVTAKGNYTGTAAASWEISIGPMTVLAPNVNTTYDKNAHGITVSVTTPASGYTIQYGTVEGTYGDTNPTITNAGTLTVYYKVTAPNYDDYTGAATVTVNPKSVTVSGITASNKTYDGNTNATLIYTGAVFTGKLDGDTLTVTAKGRFDSAAEGTGKTVNISGITLGGASKENYVLAPTGNQTTTTADITAAPVDKTTLNTKITEANIYYESIKTNYASIAATLKTAIDSATIVKNKADATAREVTNAVTAITNALSKAKSEVASQKPELKIYPIEQTKEYGDDDPTFPYWIEEVGTDYRVKITKETDIEKTKFAGKISGKLIREDGQSVGQYKIKPESERTAAEKRNFLHSDYYTLTFADNVVLTIEKKTLKSTMIHISPTSFTYNGNLREIDCEVYDGDTELYKDEDYTIEDNSVLSAKGSDTVDSTYHVYIKGKGNYQGTASKSWTIKKTSSGSGSGSGSGNGSGDGSGSDSGTTNPTDNTEDSIDDSEDSADDSEDDEDDSEEDDEDFEEEDDDSEDSSKSESSSKEDATESVDTGISRNALKQLADNTKLADSEGTLKNILGESELSRLRAEGKNPSVELTAKVMNKVSGTEKKLTESSINAYSTAIPNLTPGAFLDICLRMNASGSWQNVTSTKDPVKLTMDVPEELQKLSEEFYVLRLHKGSATLLYDTDKDPKTVTVDSNQFSTYVLLYPGNNAGSTLSANGTSKGNSSLLIWIIVGIILAAILIFLLVFYFIYIRKILEEEGEREEDIIDTRPKW